MYYTQLQTGYFSKQNITAEVWLTAVVALLDKEYTVKKNFGAYNGQTWHNYLLQNVQLVRI